jgi:hypothetical protein
MCGILAHFLASLHTARLPAQAQQVSTAMLGRNWRWSITVLHENCAAKPHYIEPSSGSTAHSMLIPIKQLPKPKLELLGELIIN